MFDWFDNQSTSIKKLKSSYFSDIADDKDMIIRSDKINGYPENSGRYLEVNIIKDLFNVMIEINIFILIIITNSIIIVFVLPFIIVFQMNDYGVLIT